MDQNYNIMIVDDVNENIKVAMNILRDRNYNFSFATNGLEALKIVKTISFDLILLDIRMPNLDGFNVIKTLKKDDKTKDIPIIFLSAKSDKDSLDNAFELGAADYITKPFHSTELLVRVEHQLEFSRLKKLLKQQNKQ